MKQNSARRVLSGVLAGNFAVMMAYGAFRKASAADSIPPAGEWDGRCGARQDALDELMDAVKGISHTNGFGKGIPDEERRRE